MLPGDGTPPTLAWRTSETRSVARTEDSAGSGDIAADKDASDTAFERGLAKGERSRFVRYHQQLGSKYLLSGWQLPLHGKFYSSLSQSE